MVEGALDVSLVEDVVVLVSGVVILDSEVLVGVEDEVELVGVVLLDDVVLGVDLLVVESAMLGIPTVICRLTFSSAPMTAIDRRKAERRKSEEADEQRILGTTGSEPVRARCGRQRIYMQRRNGKSDKTDQSNKKNKRKRRLL